MAINLLFQLPSESEIHRCKTSWGEVNVRCPEQVGIRTTMLITKSSMRKRASGSAAAFTLVEVVTAISIAAVTFGGIIYSYVQTARRAEWAAYSLAGQSLAIQQLEQARSAVWDPSIGKNEITNLNLVGWSYNNSTKTGRGYSWAVLDVPISGTNVLHATNYVTVELLYLNGSTMPPVQVYMVRVDTVWRFSAGLQNQFFTNTACTYLAPDNRDHTSI